jgi:hypothetical protein
VVVTDTMITAAVSDPTPPESVSITMDGPATETEIPAKLLPLSEDLVPSGTAQIQGTDEPMHNKGDNPRENTESKPSRTVTIGLEPEDS